MGLLYQVTLPGMKQRNMPISKLSLNGDLGQVQAGRCSDEYVHLCMSLFHLHSVVPTFHLEYGMFVSTPRSPYTDSITFCRAQYALQVSFQVLHQPTCSMKTRHLFTQKYHNSNETPLTFISFSHLWTPGIFTELDLIVHNNCDESPFGDRTSGKSKIYLADLSYLMKLKSINLLNFT